MCPPHAAHSLAATKPHRRWRPGPCGRSRGVGIWHLHIRPQADPGLPASPLPVSLRGLTSAGSGERGAAVHSPVDPGFPKAGRGCPALPPHLQWGRAGGPLMALDGCGFRRGPRGCCLHAARPCKGPGPGWGWGRPALLLPASRRLLDHLAWAACGRLLADASFATRELGNEGGRRQVVVRGTVGLAIKLR